jgi:hypothetical protein
MIPLAIEVVLSLVVCISHLDLRKGADQSTAQAEENSKGTGRHQLGRGRTLR